MHVLNSGHFLLYWSKIWAVDGPIGTTWHVKHWKIEGGKLSHKRWLCPIRCSHFLGILTAAGAVWVQQQWRFLQPRSLGGMWESSDFSLWAPSAKWMKSKCVHIFCFQDCSQFSCLSVSFSFSFSAFLSHFWSQILYCFTYLQTLRSPWFNALSIAQCYSIAE